MRVTDEARFSDWPMSTLRNTASFRFTVRDGAFHIEGVRARFVYEVAPAKAFGFGKSDSFSQTRWRF